MVKRFILLLLTEQGFGTYAQNCVRDDRKSGKKEENLSFNRSLFKCFRFQSN